MPKKIDTRLHAQMFYIGLRMPIPIVNYLDRLAVRQLRTRSDVLRSLVVEAMRAKGVVADDDDVEMVA